jgi:hypothetical protein
MVKGVKGSSSTSLLERYPSVRKWKEGLNPNTYTAYVYLFEDFMKWLAANSTEIGSYSPDELVRHQKQSRKSEEEDAEYLLYECVQRWVRTKKGRKGYLENHVKAVRSFMEHNRATLPRDRSFRIKGDYAPVPCELTMEQLRLVIDRSNPTFRAIFLMMFQSTMDQESFITWSDEGWEDLKRQLDAGEDVIAVTIPGRKNSRFATSFFTFFGGDALEALKLYLNEVRGYGPGPIFLNQFKAPMAKKPIQEYWLRQLHDLGLLKPLPGSRKVPRYGRGLHNLRDLARTNWTQRARGDQEQIEFMMGHKVDANGYFQGAQVRDKMRSHFKAKIPYMNLLTSSKPYGLVSEDRVVELEAEVQRLQSQKDGRMETLDTQVKELTGIVRMLLEKPDYAEKARKAAQQ